MSNFKSFIMTIGAKPKGGWVKWLHFSVPDDEGSDRDKARKKLELLNHCKVCTGLSGCFFPASNMPLHPQHPNCDCVLLSIATPVEKAEAYCAIEKFTGYIFSDKYSSNGKGVLFRLLGFTIGDSEYLKEEFERQAKEKYLSGDYILGNLDEHGQRITVSVSLQSKTRGDIIIKTGWMIHTLGRIACTTPYGG